MCHAGEVGEVSHGEAAAAVVSDEVGYGLERVSGFHAPEFVEVLFGVVGLALDVDGFDGSAVDLCEV